MTARERVGFPRLRMLGAALVVAVMLVGGLALSAGATTRRISSADCEALNNLSDNIGNLDSGGSSAYGKQAKAIADGFKQTAGDVSDKKLKRALLTTGGFYSALSGANNLADAARIAASRVKAYSRALKVIVKAQVACATESLTTTSTTSSTSTSTSTSTTTTVAR